MEDVLAILEAELQYKRDAETGMRTLAEELREKRPDLYPEYTKEADGYAHKVAVLEGAIAIIKAAKECAPDLRIAATAGPSVHQWLPTERRAKVAAVIAQLTGDATDVERAKSFAALLSPQPSKR